MLPPSVKPHQICRDDQKAVWQADDNTADVHYVALFNLGDEKQELSVSLEELGYPSEVSLKELWTKETSRAGSVISATVAPHACAVYNVRQTL